MNFIRTYFFGEIAATSPEADTKQLTWHDVPDHYNSCASFHSCRSVSEMPPENELFLTDETKQGELLINTDYPLTSDRQQMNNHHHIIVDSTYNHKKIVPMPLDRSKYINQNGQLFPIDYILVYTRYHSEHFRRKYQFKPLHDQYRQFFQSSLEELGFIVTEERLTDEENDLLNLRQAETAADVPDPNNENNGLGDHSLVRGLSTLQRHVSLRFQSISSHLKRDVQEMNDIVETPRGTLNADETVHLQEAVDVDEEQRNDTPNDKLRQDERYFVKIHAPFDVLLSLADKLKVKLPFSENKSPLQPGLFDEGLPCQFTRLNPEEFPPPHDGKSYFTASYQKSLHYRFSKFFGDVDKLFRPSERSRLVYEILLRCPYRSSEPINTDSQLVLKFDRYLADDRTKFSETDSGSSNQHSNNSQTETPTDKKKTLEIEKVFTSSTRRSGAKDTGIEVLLEDGVYEAAYPLHDQLIPREDAGDSKTWNDRMKLYHRWAKFNNIFRVQPIRAIRDYYGERLAFYFAWLGWYNSLLIIPSILGIFVLLWGLLSVKYDRPTLDTCNSTSSYLMCPKIDRRTYWFLNETCFNAKMSYVFDNSASVAFAIFISVFAVSVNFLWQRQEYRLQCDWDMTDIAEETETLRPDFERRVENTVTNKVTELPEPYVPAYKRFLCYTSSFSVVLLMVLLVLAVVAGIVVYRLSVSAAFNSIDRGMWVYRWKPIIVPITGALINLILILILQYFYEILAIWLTNAELHRTDKTYEASLTIKMFLFQFVNYYASIFYIALIKPLIVYKPTHLDRHSRAVRFEECDVSGCVWELSIQLIIIMVGKQLISNIWEFYFSRLWNMCRKRIQFRDTVRQINERNAKMNLIHPKAISTMDMTRSYEEDFLLQPFELTTLFYEYLEIILQFGFVTFFCLSFPLAPLFAVINNIFEIRIDALKVVKEFRRPVARRAMGIGTWNSILNIMAKVTVLSNAFIIAITSEYIPRQVYYWTIGNYSLNGFLHHTLAEFHPSDFPNGINQTILECEFLESRINYLSKQPSFLPFGQSDLYFDCNSTLANVIRSQIDFSTCYYKDYRLDHSHNYARSYMFYYVMVARLTFVIIFEHFVYSILFLVRNLIAHVPRNVRAQLNRCRYLVQQMYWGAELFAQNPDLIKKGENRVRDDEDDQLHNRQSTLPTTHVSPNEVSFNCNANSDV